MSWSLAIWDESKMSEHGIMEWSVMQQSTWLVWVVFLKMVWSCFKMVLSAKWYGSGNLVALCDGDIKWWYWYMMCDDLSKSPVIDGIVLAVMTL